MCNHGWTEARLVELVESLVYEADGQRHIPSLSEALTVFEGANLSRKARRKAIAVLGKLLSGTHTDPGLLSLIDSDPDLIEGGPLDGEAQEPVLTETKPEPTSTPPVETTPTDGIGNSGTGPVEDTRSPEEKVADIIAGAEKPISTLVKLSGGAASCDEELVEFLVANRVSDAWSEAYQSEDPARLLASLPEPSGPYEKAVRNRFAAELSDALAFDPAWSFRPYPGAPVTAPNLMQRHLATLLAKRSLLGNWSGTGAGKTAGAVAGAHAAGARRVLVVCPNNVIGNWVSTIANCYPKDLVEAKTVEPDWSQKLRSGRVAWLVVNYETLSTQASAAALDTLVGSGKVDMLVLDEAHFVKIRKSDRNVWSEDSARATAARRLRAALAEANPDGRVLLMTATPVVNDLSEARSIIELLRCEQMDDLPTSMTLTSAQAVHRHLVTGGIRFRPDYSDIGRSERHVTIDGTYLLEELQSTPDLSHPEAERILFEAKLPCIVDACVQARKDAANRGEPDRGRTLVYTELVDGVVDRLADALSYAGLSSAEMSGRVKDIDRFLEPGSDVDVLIGTSTLKVGVDGLQHAIDQIVFAILPWTPADYEQIQGRVIRQGRLDDAPDVTVLVPQVEVTVDQDGELVTGSLDRRRWSYITSKARLVSFAVDGHWDSEDADQILAEYPKWLSGWLEALKTSGRAPLPVRPNLRIVRTRDIPHTRRKPASNRIA